MCQDNFVLHRVGAFSRLPTLAISHANAVVAPVADIGSCQRNGSNGAESGMASFAAQTANADVQIDRRKVSNAPKAGMLVTALAT